MSPTYQQNKTHIYNWRSKNTDKYNESQLRAYYKRKIKCPIWREISYQFLFLNWI